MMTSSHCAKQLLAVQHFNESDQSWSGLMELLDQQSSSKSANSEEYFLDVIGLPSGDAAQFTEASSRRCGAE
jgi:hypothetical protein